MPHEPMTTGAVVRRPRPVAGVRPYASPAPPVPNPARADLTIYQGDDWSATAAVFNSDGTPADLAGWTPKAQIRRDVADRAQTVEVEIAAVFIVPAQGTISLNIAHALTGTMNGRYVWDLQLTSPAGLVTTVLSGIVAVKNEVTR